MLRLQRENRTSWFTLLYHVGPLLLLGLAPTAEAAGTLSEKTFISSVDGTSWPYVEYLPDGYDSLTVYPLRVQLHGRRGTMYSQTDTTLLYAADRAGYIVAYFDGRVQVSFYLDSDAYGPAEQDIFDMIADVAADRNIDEHRIYLTGLSMGGFGSWTVGLRNPGFFAAIVPVMGWTDCFQHWSRSGQNSPLAEAIGGEPGTSPAIDALYMQHSARMILENAIHLPVSVWHGDLDTSIPNNLVYWPYMHSHHVTDTPGFSDDHGLWPTLPQLALLYPVEGNYMEEHHWIPGAGHEYRNIVDEDSIFQFFDRNPRDENPRTLALASFDSTHVLYAWLRQRPWQPLTGQISSTRAERRPESNSLVVSFNGPHTARFDLLEMEIDPGGVIVCSTYAHGGYVGGAGIELVAPWAGPGTMQVLFDGVELTEGSGYFLDDSLLTLSSFSAATAHRIELVQTASGVEATGGVEASEIRWAGPNPARGRDPSVWQVWVTGSCEATVFDIQGRRVRTLPKFEGPSMITWDGRDTLGMGVGAGVYFLRVTGDRFEQTVRCVRLP